MKLAEKLTLQTFKKGFQTLVKDGPGVFLEKAKDRLRPAVNYDKWLKEVGPDKETLSLQRQAAWDNMPLFSIVIPVYCTPEEYLRDMLDSICGQTYEKWEICMADGSNGKDNGLVEAVSAEYQQKLSCKLKYKRLKANLGIAENTNEAISMAQGEYVVFMDHDDLLTQDALYEIAKAVKETGSDVLYSDEDKIDMNGKHYFMPHFKPDFNIDLLRSVNYICHLFAVKKNILESVGGVSEEFEGAQDYDLIFRCVEAADSIHHIPRILYHWRAHSSSTSENPQSKLYAFEAGIRAINAHYKRLGIPARAEHGVSLGIYRTKYFWQEKPLVSILIPNKDHTDDLEKCLKSIFHSAYTNYEIIIIENNSRDEKTFAYYEKLQQMHNNIHIIVWKEAFNYSKINNFGASHAKGEYLWLLNNDTEIISEDCLYELLGYAMREDVGAVGARLYYKDNTIQHAGVVIGFGGIAGHAFVNQRKDEFGYFARAMCQQDYSAVTAACMMTRKAVFEAAGGFTEELTVAFNDIDYCMKVRSMGKLIVYNPYAELYHFESKSRGAEDTREKRLRFHKEILLFAERWKEILEKGDPYYNENLTLKRADFSLKMPKEHNFSPYRYIQEVKKEVEKETVG